MFLIDTLSFGHAFFGDSRSFGVGSATSPTSAETDCPDVSDGLVAKSLGLLFWLGVIFGAWFLIGKFYHDPNPPY